METFGIPDYIALVVGAQSCWNLHQDGVKVPICHLRGQDTKQLHLALVTKQIYQVAESVTTPRWTIQVAQPTPYTARIRH
jgi:hypothetical protein